MQRVIDFLTSPRGLLTFVVIFVLVAGSFMLMAWLFGFDNVVGMFARLFDRMDG